MSDTRKDLPPVSAANFLARVREVLQVYLGSQGSELDRGLTVRDIVGTGLATLNPNGGSGTLLVPSVPTGGTGGGSSEVYEPDLTIPPSPSSFTAVAGLTSILVETEPPIYSAGHGHGVARLFGVTRLAGDPLPTFASAVELSQFQGDVTSYATGLGKIWHLWLIWRSKDGVDSAPAGGTNGVSVTTGKIGNADVSDLAIEASKLAEGAIDLTSNKVKASSSFGALAVGYTVTQYLVSTSGVMGNLGVDNAQISGLSAAKLTVGDGTIGGDLRSTNYVPGTSGWIVRPSGFAEFSATSIRGKLTADQIDGRGLSILEPSGGAVIQLGTAIDWAKLGGAGSNLSGLGYTGALDATRNVYRGAWVSGLVYKVGDVVTSAGSSWSAKTEHTAASGTNAPPALPATSNTWWELAAAKGDAGVNGSRTAILEMYQWAAAVPTTFPSGNSTYTWATGQFTAPATANGWSLTPPAAVAGQTLWMCRTVYADSLTAATTIISWSATAAVPAGGSGASGANGTRTAVLELYQWAAAAPSAFPVGSSTYTWATGAFTAPGTANGWTLTPGAAVAGQTLWGCSVSHADTGTSATSAVTWSASTAYALGAAGANGSPGTNGTRTAILEMYQWAASAPATFPAGSSTYTWATGQFTAPATVNGWAITPPAPVVGQTLWVCRTVFADSLTSATSAVTWSASAASPAGASGSNGSPGANGTRTAILELYRWAASTPTTFPSGSSTYTWATGAFTAPGTPNGWSLTPGAAVAGQTLWGCTVSYADTATSSTSTVTWSTSTAYAIGAAGTNGSAGAAGASAISSVLSNEAHVFPAATDGTVATYAGSGTEIRVYEGATELSYDGVGTANGTWKATTAFSNITPGTLTDSGTYLTVGAHSGVAAGTDASSITYTITGKSSAGVGFTITKSQTFGKSKAGAAGSVGSTGATGPAGPAVVTNSSRATTFTSTDGTLDAAQADIVFAASVSGISSPTYVWSFSGFQTAPTNSGASTQTVTSAQFGTAKAATVTCTVSGAYVDVTTIVRLERNTADAAKANGALQKAGDTITGRINMSVSDGLFAGTDTNNGVYMGNGGIVGKKGGATTFAVDTAGNASFAGTLNVSSAASGARMEIKNNVIKVFDSGGVLRVQIGDLSA